MRIGFVGPSYTSKSSAVADEECLNLFAETTETQGSVAPAKSYGGSTAQGLKSYYGTPGLAVFATMPRAPIRGMAWADKRLFVVGGSLLIELNPDGSETFHVKTIPNDGGLVSIAVSNTQLLVVTAGTAWCYTLSSNSITEVTAQMAGVPVKVEFSDGYFIVCFKNSNLFQISGILDGLTWPGLQVNEVSVFPEDVTSIICNHRELLVFGAAHAQPYQNTGSDEIFDSIPGTLIEKGCMSTFSTCRLDNTVFWIDQDERGARSAWRLQGYTPSRISTHAVEYDLATYDNLSVPDTVILTFTIASVSQPPFSSLSITFVEDIPANSIGNVFSFSGLTTFTALNGTSDAATAISGKTVTFSHHAALGTFGSTPDTGTATTQQVVANGDSGLVSYAYQDIGHTFWVLYVAGSAWSWVYDAAEALWHKRAAWDAGTSTFGAHHSWNHVLAFGKHLVGDWATGNLWEMNLDFLDDAGTAIRRLRRAPTVMDEMQWIMHADLTVDFETGLGPTPPLLDGSGNPRAPQATLRWSDNRGKTWSTEHVANCGLAGEFNTRVIWRRLGRSRYRVFELSMTDPVRWNLVDAYLNLRNGT